MRLTNHRNPTNRRILELRPDADRSGSTPKEKVARCPSARYNILGEEDLLPGVGGVPRCPFFYSPKTGGQGVDRGSEKSLSTERVLCMDSRLRGNDKRGYRDSSLPRVPGDRPTPFPPPRAGSRGIEGFGVIRGSMQKRCRRSSCRGFGGVPQFPPSPKIEDPPQEEWGPEVESN